MDWIFIAIVSGVVMTAPFQTEEACLGKKAIMGKNNINGKCFDMRSNLAYVDSSGNWINVAPNTVLTPSK